MKFVTHSAFDTYFNAGTRQERLQTLRKWHKDGTSLPLAVTDSLFQISLSHEERIALLECTQPEDRSEYEFWIYANLLKWPQDVAAIALRSWAEKTNCHLWHRLAPIIKMPGLPQRLSYTILDICPNFSGRFITSSLLATAGWEDFSPAYHALLFDRAIQFDCSSKRLDILAKKVVESARDHVHPDDKSLESAATWLIRSGNTSQLKEVVKSAPSSTWKSLLETALGLHEQRKKSSEKILKALSKIGPQELQKAIDELPPPWSRLELSIECLQTLFNQPHLSMENADRILHGCSFTAISTVVQESKNADSNAVMALQKWLGTIPAPDSELQKEREIMTAPSSNFSQLNSGSTTSGKPKTSPAALDILEDGRFEFFNCISKGSLTPKEARSSMTQGEFWNTLARVWQSRDPSHLQALTVESRKQRGLAKVAYLMTLGRLTRCDEAVLKIMDHIRTTEEDELRVLASSLGEIDTPRSLLELISVITRPNATPAIQQDAVGILSKKDVSNLQKELRATVQDLKVPEDPTSPIAEIREALVNLIAVPESDITQIKSKDASSNSSGPINDRLLDQELAKMIPNYTHLSSEVRRALRTALFFNQTISGSETSHAIDLSPLIDMQYKAMELLYREFFEDAVSQTLHKGDISRKLDVIGYARPIPAKMDEFENYIAALPTVREIPFFSKFKLRKMLRALCQFQPGKRFTLDGLKAFGLFFLCFSRQQCRFGLGGQFPIGTRDDTELAEFTKELHTFQDFRNRAAHEGFHPEASNDIQGIWRSTALIVQWAFKIRENLQPAVSIGSNTQKKAS